MGISKRAIIFIIIFTLLLTDIVVVNYEIFFSPQKEMTPKDMVVESPPQNNSATISAYQKQNIIDSCYPDSCVDLIREATASLSLSQSPKKTTVVSQSQTVKEFYIPFGSGQTQSSEYENGAEAYIDSSKYGKIKTVTFEASMYIPTVNGRMYAQLYDVTDQHPVWFSEVSTDSGQSQLLVSPSITLDSGNKLYQVQLKTTLSVVSILDQARVHIITQ